VATLKTCITYTWYYSNHAH